MTPHELENTIHHFANSPKLPLLFFGHGHPMNALYDNRFTQTLRNIGKNLEKPQAVMMVSAHWHTNGTYVSVNPAPKTIYDFGRFDDRLFQIRYEPAGHPVLAKNVIEIAPEYKIAAEPDMGLDHGACGQFSNIFFRKPMYLFFS